MMQRGLDVNLPQSRRAQVLLPVSEATAAGLTDILGIDPARMSVIHTVLGDEFRPSPAGAVAAFRERYRLPERFLLYVAHLFPHKNHLRLLDAYARLGAAGPVWPLVFRGDAGGAEDKIHSRVRDLGLEKSVSLLPRLGASDMGLLYSAATAFVFPSLFEGGGIPVVEAIACGLPVAASRIPSVVEFAGPAALYFNPLDVTSIAAALERLMDNAGRLEIMRRAGLARAENFRPDAVIPKLLQAYRRAAAKR